MPPLPSPIFLTYFPRHHHAFLLEKYCRHRHYLRYRHDDIKTTQYKRHYGRAERHVEPTLSYNIGATSAAQEFDIAIIYYVSDDDED